jgi:hypothetical protein
MMHEGSYHQGSVNLDNSVGKYEVLTLRKKIRSTAGLRPKSAEHALQSDLSSYGRDTQRPKPRYSRNLVGVTALPKEPSLQC